jgi:CheY-like chemotaxis protein
MTDETIHISDMAEGVYETGEAHEPESPLHTTILPAVENLTGTSGPAAETGLLSQVRLTPEGKDGDDAQDAAPTNDETQPMPVTQKAGQMTPTRPPTVLIIEDTTELAEVIQATLERMKMITAHETHGSKALAKFYEMKPDVVLLDISLPDMTGWKILDAIKEQQEQGTGEKMPAIIVITAYGDPANRLVGKLQGVFSYLVKPFTADEVENIVSQALGGGAVQ